MLSHQPTTRHQQPTFLDEFFARLKHLSGLIRIVVKTMKIYSI